MSHEDRRRRLSPVQRLVLAHILDRSKQGKPAIIAEGHKKTRVGYIPSLESEGVATCSTTLYFLRHHGLIERVKVAGGSSASFSGYYRLTSKGEAALGIASPSGVHTTEAQWKRRTEAGRG
jgi:hypothetical protein